MGEVAPLLDLMQKAGPYALFLLMFYLWKEERRERMDTQKSFRELMTDGLQAMNGTENALRELRRLFTDNRRDRDDD